MRDTIRQDEFQSPEHEAELGREARSVDGLKEFVKPTLSRHDSLPKVTAGVVAGFTP